MQENSEADLPLAMAGCEPEQELRAAGEAAACSWSAEESAAEGATQAPCSESAVVEAQGEEPVSVALSLPVASMQPLGLPCPATEVGSL